MKNQQNKTGRNRKEAWPYPVSRAFYEKIRAKGVEIFKDLGYGRLWIDELMKLINGYILLNDCPQRRYTDETLLTVFTCLRLEIDQAIRRSAEARRRAAERRAAKLAQKQGDATPSRMEEESARQTEMIDSEQGTKTVIKKRDGQVVDNEQEKQTLSVPTVIPDRESKVIPDSRSEPKNTTTLKRPKRIRRNAVARRHP